MNKSDLRMFLARLMAGKIPESEIYDTIHLLGEEGFVEAKPVVESFLSHPDPGLRYIALNVLTLHWGCNEYRNTCEEFLKKDSDSDNRRLGASGLGSLLRGSRDRKALELLLGVFRDEAEEWHVRDSAYSSILDILGKPKSEQPPATRKLDYSRDVNWDYISEAERIVEYGENATTS